MANTLSAKTDVVIDAPVESVWKALITPELIAQYLFGTKTETTWKVGDPITFSGEYEGKKYQDKGTILEFEPRKKLKYSYWSSMSGKEDVPENYLHVSFIVHPEGDHKTRLELVQDRTPDKESLDHSLDNWKMVLGQLKRVAEEVSRQKAF